MTSRRFLILHGLASRREPEHWHHWLAGRLRARGEQVLYPQLPRPDDPDLEEWLDLLHAELGMLGKGERVVLCHSLSCQLWLHAAARAGSRLADRVLLVAPPSPAVVAGLAPGFCPPPDGVGAAVERAAGRTLLVGSDDDPYDPPGPGLQARALGVPLVLLANAGHVNPASGYGPWPAAEAWCLSGRPDAFTARLDATRSV